MAKHDDFRGGQGKVDKKSKPGSEVVLFRPQYLGSNF